MKNFNLKLLFAKENILYTIIVVLGFAVIITNRIVVGFNDKLWFLDFASIAGCLYIVLVAKHNFWGLVLCLVSTLLLLASDIMQHLWLNAFICALISTPNLTMGIILWKRNEKIDATKNLKSLSKKNLFLVSLLYAVVSVVFAYILYLLNGNLFYLDAIYSAGCAIGIVLCSFAFIDQFYFFIFSSFFGIAMYIMLAIQNPNNIPIIFTNVIYLVVNTIGYFNWRKLIKEQQSLKLAENKEKENEKIL